jgi:molybdopterin/thiamine biosynthesis adenylyltransferase
MSTIPARRYRRHQALRWLGEPGQERLQGAHAAVIGLGALGSVAAATLARAGVGHLTVVDRDLVEPENLGGQVLYTEEDVELGLPKAVAAGARLQAINSRLQIKAHVADVTSANIGQLLENVHIVLDGTDNFETRFLINDLSHRRGTPWIYTGAIGHYGYLLPIFPGRSACLRCLYRSPPPAGSFGTCDIDGIFAPVSQIMGNLEAAEAIKVLSGNLHAVVSDLLTYDGWRQEMERIPVAPVADCPACTGNLEYLDARDLREGLALCGSQAVQVPGRPGTTLDLAAIALRLQGAGLVKFNKYILHFRTGDHELSLFPDGRAIVKGTTDLTVAKSLYTRYFGM